MLTIVSQDDPPLANPPAAVAESESGEESTGDKVVVAATQAPREPERLDPGLLLTAQKLSGLLPAGTALAYSRAGGLGWQDSNGTYVYIGSNVENFDQKFALYQQIAAELSNRGIQPALISVEYLNTPYYRLEQ